MALPTGVGIPGISVRNCGYKTADSNEPINRIDQEI